MKSYPSIPHSQKFLNLSCIAFKKEDGSNLRFEWSKKSGWYKAGTRTKLFDKNDFEYGSAIPLFEEKFAKSLSDIFIKKIKCDRAIVYCEWFGPNSFAGRHIENDQMMLVLFDVNIHKKGLIEPKTFVEIFSGEVQCAEVLYKGTLSTNFVESVRNNNDIGEGVVCKGGERHDLWMCKIKTNAYLAKLKEKFGQHWQQHWE